MADPGGTKARTRLPKGAVMTFLVLLVLGGFNFADQGILIPFYDQVQKEFGLSQTAVGVIGSSFIAVVGVVMVLWGFFADKYSRKKLLLFGAFLWSITAYAVTWVRTYEELLLVRTLGGIGIGSFFPVAFSMTADLFGPGQRGKAAAWLNMLPAVGAVGGGVVAVIYGELYGWRYPFQIVGLGGLVATAVFWFLMKEPARAQTEPEFEELIGRGEAYAYRVKLSDWKILYREKANLFLILQGIPGTVPWGVLLTWAIFYLKDQKGFPTIFAFGFLAGFLFGALVGNIIGGYLGDRLARKGIQRRVPLCVLGILGGMALIVFILWRDIPPLPPGMFTGDFSEIPRFAQFMWERWEYGIPFNLFILASALATLTGPNWFAIMQDINLPEIRGSVSGVNNVMSQVGSGLGPLLGGLLADALGLRMGIIIASLFWVGCAAFWLPLWWHLPRAEKRVRETLGARARGEGETEKSG
ncbi:MAG: MFS transporter [Halobacteria archaeon]